MSRLTKRDVYGCGIPTDYLDDDCCDCSEYCQKNRNCRECNIQACFTKLADYEEAEEQGRLFEFPVAVGDMLYYVPDWLYDKCIDELTVTGYALLNSGKSMLIGIKENEPKQHLIKGNLNSNMIGKSVFRTKEEAAAKLKELEDENAN